MAPTTNNFNLSFTFGGFDICGNLVVNSNNVVTSLQATNITSTFGDFTDISNNLITSNNKPATTSNSLGSTITYSVAASTIDNSFTLTITTSGSTKQINFDNVLSPLSTNGILFYIKTVGGESQNYFIQICNSSVRSLVTEEVGVFFYSGEGDLLGGGGASEGTFSYNLDTVLTPDPICMPAGTVVQTDQGWFNIETLYAGMHTIDGQRLVAVTKTKSKDNRLVLFKKNALGPNVPEMDTFLTLAHKVCLDDNTMVEAEQFLRRGNNPLIVSSRLKDDEILYNVLLETYHVMTVNNMLVETLHPNNPVARLYQQQEQKEENASCGFFENSTQNWF